MSNSVERALRILVELSEGPTTISELGRRLDVHRTTSLRLLRTLEEERFVRRADDGSYRLGPRMAALAAAALDGLDIRASAARHLAALGRTCGQTIHLGVLEDGQVMYLDKVESRQAVRMYSHIGALAPLHATGIGKALLAYMSAGERDALLGEAPYPRCTPHTLTDRAALDTVLDRITRQGWSLDDFEHEEYIHCVAAPVFDAAGRVAAAISISAPSMILDRPGLLAFTEDLTATAQAISEELGWRRR
ncbi:IclR family transcriptional regulator [Nocardiopsis sp. MG754419]|uniref:IclR family transcriptional regulator n=1 Tax=Nocardiopsis sp. MG754419 TaxID=2259865 RepID=UPI001BA6F3CC|nr:IclR family transcriptional regulator [Nocardiopsis sp. MG754419]MBR8743008.1 IclR family transcriptional regulator [Nocardiopsis sp. MG754419]